MYYLQSSQRSLSTQAVLRPDQQDLEFARSGVPVYLAELFLMGSFPGRFLKLIGDYHFQATPLGPGYQVRELIFTVLPGIGYPSQNCSFTLNHLADLSGQMQPAPPAQ